MLASVSPHARVAEEDEGLAAAIGEGAPEYIVDEAGGPPRASLRLHAQRLATPTAPISA